MKRPAHGAFNGKGGSSSSSFAKAKKHPTLHQAGISYKKVYITDNKHVIRKNASKRSEGMRD